MSQTKAQLISDLVEALNFTGTSSAPANGMYLSAANTIKLATNSSPRLTIDSSGNATFEAAINLKTTLKLFDVNSPNDENVHINSQDDVLTIGAFGTNGAFKVKTGSSNTLALTVDSSQNTTFTGHVNLPTGFSLQWSDSHERIEQSDGKIEFFTGNGQKMTLSSDNLGIGTSSPDNNLHVKGSGTDVLKVESTDAGAQGTNLILQHSPGAGNMADNDVISLLQFAGVDDSNNATTYSSIRAVATDVSNNNESGDITFHTRNAGTFDERVRIQYDGKVGIGTTSPGAGLDIKVDTNPVLVIDRGSTNTANLNLKYNGTLTAQISAANEDFQISAAGASTPISFYTNGGVRATLDSSGNLGIGSTAPYSNASYNSLTIGSAKKGLIEIKNESNVAKAHLYENSGDFNISTVGGTGSINFVTGGTLVTALSIDQNQGAVFQGDVIAQDAVYLSNSSTISSRFVLSSSNASSWTGSRDLVALDLIGNGADHRTGTLSIKCKKGAADADPTEMMRIDGVYNLTKIISGNLDLVDGDLKVADGHGIDFSATSGTGASELLDDYEEGTWTPTFVTNGASTTFPTQSYAEQSGFYTKVGDLVFLTFNCKLADSGITGGTNYAALGGFPFPIYNSTAARGLNFSISFWEAWDGGSQSNNTPMGAMGVNNASWAYLMGSDNSRNNYDYIAAQGYTNGTRLMAAITYKTN